MDANRTLSVKMQELRDKGYTVDFQIEDGLLINSTNTSAHYPPEDVKIIEHHRFEGMSNPADLSILYAMETPDGKKGLLVDGYGIYSSKEVTEFIKQIPI